MKYMYKNSVLLNFSEIRFLRIERDMCVFSWRLQRHTTTTSLSHTHTLTHTHTHDGPTVDARSSGSRFFGFLQF